MKTILLIIIGISATVFLVGIVVYPYLNETTSDDTHNFEYRIGLSDNFDETYFEKWCSDHSGIWIKSETFCGFETETDEQLASMAFHDALNPQISQEKTQAICKFLEMECPPHAMFTGSLDAATGEIFVNYEYKKIPYKFDVTTSEIKYRIGYQMGQESDWSYTDPANVSFASVAMTD